MVMMLMCVGGMLTGLGLVAAGFCSEAMCLLGISYRKPALSAVLVENELFLMHVTGILV